MPVSADNPLPAVLPGNKTGAAVLAALNDVITVETGIKGAAAIRLTGVNAGAVVTFYGSVDGGVTFDIPVNATPFSTGGDNTPVSTAAAAGLYTFNGGIFTHVQARLTTAGGGSFTAKSVATPAVRNIGLPALGSALDSAATSDSGTFTLISLFKRLLGKLPAGLVGGSLVTTLRDAAGNAVDFSSTVPTIGTSPYPAGATPFALTGSAGVGNTIVQLTVPAVVGKIPYFWISITGGGATAAAVVDVTVTNTSAGTMTFNYGAVAGAGVPNTPLREPPAGAPPIVGVAANTACVITCPALGSGNTKNNVNIFGYYL